MNPIFHYVIIAIWTLMVFIYTTKVGDQADRIEKDAEIKNGKCKDAREMLSAMSINYTDEIAEHKRDIKRFERIIAEKDKEIERLKRDVEWWESLAKRLKLGGCRK